MASGDLLCAWGAAANQPPSSAYATLDTRNSHPVLDFDATTDEEAVFADTMPSFYSGGSLNVRLLVGCTSATTGSVRWQTDFERVEGGVLDIDADSFSGTFQSGSLTVPATAGIFTVVTILHTNAQIDGIINGSRFRLKVRRDADGTSGTDDATGDAELLSVHLEEA